MRPLKLILTVLLITTLLGGCEDKPPSETEETGSVCQLYDHPATNKSHRARYLHSMGELFADLNDYTVEAGQAKIISEQPLHFNIYPFIFPNDDKKLIDEVTQEAFIYYVWRVFIHLPTDKLTIEVTPKLNATLNNPLSAKPLNEYTIKAHITREQAVASLKKHTPFKSFDELISTDKQWNTPETAGLIFSDEADQVRHTKEIKAALFHDLITPSQ